MGLLDYFKKDAADDRKRERARAKLTNMYYQQADRMAAAESAYELAKAGDPVAVEVLLARFEHLCPSQTVDREEKEHVVNLLVSLGDRGVPVIVDYCTKLRKPVYWPFRVLERLWPAEKVESLLAEILEGTDNEYWRDPEKKIGLMQMAIEVSTERVTAALVPFVEDQLEEVRFRAVDALVQRRADIAAALLPRLAADEESGRIVALIAKRFADAGWGLGDAASAVSARLPRGFAVVDGKVVAR
ncbi:MAG: hypothetical protein H6698_04945 [Myxococcales bacterium]|nr:hypothetical protein [Myxococcales bacterium]MCB9519711.1 hypothetical protein [Myxococcales bacterium]MCB9530402.1 hypothetical protein [Myxococcales bacterium]MCB9533649.1 hypothetical protein [Myxococcales bacterium]